MNAAAMIHRAGEIIKLPGFESRQLWLTFYLTADPPKLDQITGELSRLDAVNLGGSDSAFLYPKLPISNEPTAIAARVRQVLDLAATCGVQVVAVDLDTSSDVGSSLFKELVRL